MGPGSGAKGTGERSGIAPMGPGVAGSAPMIEARTPTQEHSALLAGPRARAGTHGRDRQAP
jgi:hypothetical protein